MHHDFVARRVRVWEHLGKYFAGRSLVGFCLGNARTIKLIEGACLHGFSFSLRPENIDPVICVSARMRCATELGNSALPLASRYNDTGVRSIDGAPGSLTLNAIAYVHGHVKLLGYMLCNRLAGRSLGRGCCNTYDRCAT